MKITGKRLVKPLLTVGFTVLITGTAFAAGGGGGIFSSVDTIFQYIVDAFSGTTGKYIAIIIFSVIVLAAWVGYKNFWHIGLAAVFIALFFGAKKFVEFIIDAAM